MDGSDQELQSLLLQCEQALLTLYNNKTTENRQTAHQWLLQTQKSPQAWQLCWGLMAKDKAAEIQFFGSSMLHFKISKYWSELPEHQYEPLKSEIFKHILAYSAGPKIVLTRLCVALGSFILHTIPEHWENASHEIITTLQSVSSSQAGSRYNALLELLTVLPEEFISSEHIATRRLTLRGELQQMVPNVLQITQTELSSSNSSNQEKLQALRCLTSWVQFGLTIFELDHLLPLVFEATNQNELFDGVIDLLVEVISHPTSHKYPNCVWKFASSLVTLHPMLQQGLQSSDMDVVCGLCRLIVSFAESHTRLIIFPDTNQRHLTGMHIVQQILECTNAPGWYPVDENCSEMTLNFWFTLQDDIYSQDSAVQFQLRSTYEPVFTSLCQIFLKKVQYPPESEWASYSSDEKEQFQYYRQDVSDTMMYIYCVTGPLLLQQLHAALSALLNSHTAPSWQSIEATLHLVQAVAENVEPEEDIFLPAILSLLPNLPTHPKVSQTALIMVGSYSEWLNCHTEQLRSVLPVLLSGLTKESLASSSTQALRGICEECVHDLDHDILQEVMTHCQAALAGSTIKDRERIRCMECIGYILSVQPQSVVMEKLQTAIGPYIQLLAQIVTQQPSKDLKPRLQFYLKMFAVLFKCLDPGSLATNQSHPAAVVLKEVMPSLKSLGSWISDNEITQDLCLCLERAVDTIRDHMGSLVPDVAQLILDYYTLVPQSCILDTATMFVGMYGGEKEHIQIVALTFQRLSTMVLQNPQSNLQDHPDILQSYLALVQRGLKTNTGLVFECEGMAEHVYQCGLAALNANETQTVQKACHLLVTFIGTYETHDKTRQILDAYGQHLVQQVLMAIGGGVSRHAYLNDYLSEILFSLNKRCIEQLSRWLQNVLQIQGFPSAFITPEQKQQFTSSVLRGRAHRRRFKETVKEFSLVCRGLQGVGF